MDAGTRPEEQVFRAHLAAGPFQSGVARHRWRLLEVSWPQVVIAVRAIPRRGAPDEYAFRFDCNDYPQSPPTARPWDAERREPLLAAQWPGGVGRVQHAFSPIWNAQALYLPCDRLAIAGHDHWRVEHPSLLWSPAGDITQYLRILHDLLHSRDYSGLRGP